MVLSTEAFAQRVAAEAQGVAPAAQGGQGSEAQLQAVAAQLLTALAAALHTELPPVAYAHAQRWQARHVHGMYGMCMWHVHVHVHVHGMCTACARHVHGMCTACTHARAPKIEAPRASPLPGISVCSRQASRAIRCNPMHQRLQPYASGGHHAPSAGPRPPVCGVGGAWPGGVW